MRTLLALALVLPAVPAAAQVPETTKIAEKGADILFNQGVVGVMLVLFIAIAAIAVWKLIDCHKTHKDVAVANATAIATDAAAKEDLAKALGGVDRRLEMIERKLGMQP